MASLPNPKYAHHIRIYTCARDARCGDRGSSQRCTRPLHSAGNVARQVSISSQTVRSWDLEYRNSTLMVSACKYGVTSSTAFLEARSCRREKSYAPEPRSREPGIKLRMADHRYARLFSFHRPQPGDGSGGCVPPARSGAAKGTSVSPRFYCFTHASCRRQCCGEATWRHLSLSARS